MRILHTSDWHLGKNLEGNSRMDEQELFLNDFVNIVKENNIDLVIIAGDVYDTANPPARAEKIFYDTLKKISQNGKVMTLVIAGNHDNPDRIVSAGPLAMEHGIVMVGTPKTIVPIGEYGKHRILNSGEGFIEIEINDEKAVILTLPYPSEKRLNEVLYNEMDDEDNKLKDYSQKIKSLFDKLKENFREDTINLVATHLYIMGCSEAGSERSVQLGGSFILDGSILPSEAQYVALGHIHRPLIVQGTNKKARYCGAPIHYNKKEIHFENLCYMINVSPNKEAIIQDIKLNTYKPIEIWKCSSIEDAIEKCENNKDKNCWVYMEVETDRYIKENEIKLMKDLKNDILEIQPKITSSEYEVDIEQISQKSFEELFREFYKKERNVEVQQEVVDMLMKILGEDDTYETN